MTPEPPNKIVITSHDLRDPKIDEVIELQRQSIHTPVRAPEKKRGFRLIYATWFYMAIAGALGAFLAWAVIEPFFDDGIIFTGRLQQVDESWSLGPLRGRIEVSGVSIYLLPQHTRIGGGTSANPQRYSLSDLKPGQIVKVQGMPTPVRSALVGIAVRVEDPETPAEPVVNLGALVARNVAAAFAFFPLVAGLVALMVGSVEGIICRTFARAAWCGGIGLISGLLGGLASFVVANIVYGFIQQITPGTGDPTSSGPAFVFQMFQRGLAWTIAGTTMGLGQGFALKSSKLKLNGFIGGMVGGLVGGLLFDPIGLVFSNKELMQGAELSRAVGFTIIGGVVGAMIGLTELLTRDAWLKVTQGPLRGKEFSFNRTPIRLGSSPKNEIYLFKDTKIDPVHAEINKLRDTYEIADNSSSTGTFVNGQGVRRHRLVDGDLIRIGDSEFSYFSKEKTAG